tara:strand:- start:2416 stop:3243 length:828 start_codon:yes stop_codon:yes gene_type:complete
MNKFSLLLVFFLSGVLYSNPTSWGGSDDYGILLLLGFWAVILFLGLISVTVESVKEKVSTIPGPFIFFVLILFLVSVFLIFSDGPRSLAKSENKRFLEQKTTEVIYPDADWSILPMRDGILAGGVHSKKFEGDALYVFMREDTCALEDPFMRASIMQRIASMKYKDFDISSYEGKSMELILSFDDGEYEINYIADIIRAFHLDNQYFVYLDITSLYDVFVGMDKKFNNLLGWQRVNIKISEADPIINEIFPFPGGRTFNMTGFRSVLAEQFVNCK